MFSVFASLEALRVEHLMIVSTCEPSPDRAGFAEDDVALVDACWQVERERTHRQVQALERLCALLPALEPGQAWDDALVALPAAEAFVAACAALELGWLGGEVPYGAQQAPSPRPWFPRLPRSTVPRRRGAHPEAAGGAAFSLSTPPRRPACRRV